MFERKVDTGDIRAVLESGETIENYPDDLPYPSRLILGWRGKRPLHVVAADNAAGDEVIIVTVYEPDVHQWESDFRRRKR
jgi:hypothetical protein